MPPIRSGALACLLLTFFTAAALAQPSSETVSAPKTAPKIPAPAQIPTPEQTRAEFEAVCKALKASSNDFYGTAQVPAMEARLKMLPEATEEAIRLRQRLASEKLRLGENEAAVQLLGEALQRSAVAKLPARLQLQLLLDLGLAYLRLGEVRNCVARHTPEMCIFPITEGGRHAEPQAAKEAQRAFRAVLEGVPGFPLARWLLTVAAMTTGDYPEGVPPALRLPPERLRSTQSFPAFADVAHEVGLHIFDTSGGALVEDFDGDGWLDVLTSSIDPCAPLRFFRNRGNGTFEARSVEAGLDGQLGGLNLVAGDYDGDGDVDFLVLRGGWLAEDGRMRNSLMRNRGNGTFEDVTALARLAEPAYPTQTAAWADYDGDGDLDLYIGNEGPEGSAYPSQLFRSEIAQGRHAFTEVGAAAGVTNGHWAKGVAWGDTDDDGDPDLYVSNLGPNRLYRNDGDGTFTDVAPELGVTEPAQRSFTTWFFDHDNDGDLDLFVADYSASVLDMARHLTGDEVLTGHPRLYRNDGGRFTDISRAAGLGAPSLPMGANFGDLDGDGFLDLYLGTGLPNYEALTPNLMYLNRGGEGFVDVTAAGRFGHLQKGHGVAFADVDNDGDQDVFEQMGGAFPGDAYASVLYRNPGHGNAWLRLELEGTPPNRAAYGARVEVVLPDGEGTRSLFRTVGAVSSFGGNPRRLEIGLGKAKSIRAVRVRWPSGKREEHTELEPGKAYRIVEGQELVEQDPSEKAGEPPALPNG